MFDRGKDLFTDFVKDHYEIKKNSKDSVKITTAKLFLNSIYGRMGMKDIDSTIEILSLDEAKELEKKNNISIFSQIGKNKVLVKYSDRIPKNIKYKNNKLDSIDSIRKILDKTQLKELDF
jgi:hypothetical protein